MENHVLRLKELGRRHGLKLSIEPYDLNPCADLKLGNAADVPMCEFWSKGYGFPTEFSCFEAVLIAHTLGRRVVGAGIHRVRGRAVAPVSRFDEGAGRLGTVYRHQPICLPSLSTSAAARPVARHDHGPNRRSLGTHPDLVGYGPGVPSLSGPLPANAATWPPRCRHLVSGSGGRTARIPCARFSDAGHAAGPRGYNFDGCDPETLISLASVNSGRIVLADGMSYRVLVLPRCETMTPRLLRKIRELIEAGAR